MKVAVCDKDIDLIRNIDNVLKEIGKRTEFPLSVFLYTNPFEMLAHFSNYRDLDILIVNIEMEHSFDVAKELRKLDKRIKIIFIAQKGNMAIKGYAVNASYYFLKPVNITVFEKVLTKLINEVMSESMRFVLIRNKDRLDKIYFNEIKYIETCQRKTIIHTIQEKYVSNITMKVHLDRLQDYGFVQVHSGYIVNIDFIKNVLTDKIILRDGEKIALSKKRKKLFMKTINNYFSNNVDYLNA